MRARFWLTNLLCLLATALAAATFFYPVWSLAAKAVQYQTEFPEGLRVYAYLSKVEGDVYELNLMSKWIGARFPARVPEQVVFPVLYGGAALLSFASIFFNHRKRRVLALALALFFLLALTGAGTLQWRLYAFGHIREPYPPAEVPDFTIPLVGSARFWNWRITTALGAGAYAMIGVAILVALAYVTTPREPRGEATGDGDVP